MTTQQQTTQFKLCPKDTSLVAQMVEHLLTKLEMRVQSLGWEDLEKEMVTQSSILAWKIPWTGHGVAKSQTRLSDFTFT